MKKKPPDLTYQRIKQKILDGEYAPSQRLVEITLAEDLGVGRHKIRVALERLQSDGLVQIEPNRGATVKSLDLTEVLDILVARETLEAGAATLATERIEADHIQQFAECLEIMRVALDRGEYDRYSATNKRFHNVIYEASGNETIPQLINLLRQRLARLQLRTILIPGRMDKSIGEHEAIFEAFEVHDAVAAEEATRAHLRSLRTAIQSAWQLVRI